MLAAGNGRHARASIPRQIHEDAPAAIFYRLRAAPTPEAVAWSPFDRPTTTATRMRGYSLAVGSTYPGPRHPRHGLSVAPHSLNVRQVEISGANGTTTLDGQTVTRHTLTSHLSVLIGFMTLSKDKGVGFVTTVRTDYARTYAVLQYLDGSGVSTSEFVMESSGIWDSNSYGDGLGTSGGSKGFPLLSMPSYLVVDAGDHPAFLDYVGNQVSVGVYPQGNGGPTKVIVCLPNADTLIVPANNYRTTPYSTDFGKTWGTLQLWGGRVTSNPGALAPPFNYVTLFSTAMPLQVT